MRAGPTRGLVGVVAVAAALLLVPSAHALDRTPALAPAAPDSLTRALAAGELTEAEYALERAVSLFELGDVRARHGLVARAEPHGATLVLRDLVARLGDLSPADRARAEALLARPTDQRDPGGNAYRVPEAPPVCTTNACIHYVLSTNDAPAGTDTNVNGVPDWIDTTAEEIERIWAKEVVEYGFRAPKSDLTSSNHGPDGRIDIYIADVGAERLYGYCTTDDPDAGFPRFDVSAYCVLDDDYAQSQFPSGANGVAALQVTAAHEFFHAVQAAYDFFDDGVLMEGTAVWMEDEVYDDVDDNYQYLAASALERPDVPWDLALTNFGNDLAGFQYGSFVFYRYLSERLGRDIVRAIWERADAAPGAPDDYSVQAIDHALAERGRTFRGSFAGFTAANAFPSESYEEGAAYPTPPALTRAVLTRTKTTASGSSRLDHLTSAYASFRPGLTVKRDARLRITVDLPPRARGSEAAVVTALVGAPVRTRTISLSADGNAVKTVAFGRGRVASVVLVLTNASARYDCYRGSPFACAGVPLDENLLHRFSARLLQSP